MSSNSQPEPGQSRQPASYPSPTSYPDPSMSNSNNQNNYPPPNNQQPNESYRASPTGSNSSMSHQSLPGIQHMGSPIPHQPVAQMGGQYYHNQGQTLPHPSYPNVTSDPNGANMRYALPVTDNRIMSGGRHKKVRVVIYSSSTSRPRIVADTFPWCRRSSVAPRLDASLAESAESRYVVDFSMRSIIFGLLDDGLKRRFLATMDLSSMQANLPK